MPQREVGDGRGIQPTGKKAAERDVRDELAADCLIKVMPKAVDGLLVREGLDLLRVADGPETSHHGSLPFAPFDARAGQHLADTFDRRTLAGGIKEREVRGDRGRIRREVDVGQATQRFDLGSETMARGGARPIERLHAGGVTGEQHPPLRRKPSGEGKDAVEPGQAFLAMPGE